MKIRLSYVQRIRWFINNYYETGMEYEILFDSFRNKDLNNIEWYDDIIKIPEFVDELEENNLYILTEKQFNQLKRSEKLNRIIN